MSERDAPEPEGTVPDVPDWDDEYVDRVSDRLMFNYDLEKDHAVDGERFTLYGRMDMASRKQFFHPALSYAHQRSTEHLYVKRADSLRVADVERYVGLGHDLAEDIEADEEHFGTDYVFAFVVPEIDDAVREFVADFTDRTKLKYGYYGQYRIQLLVVAPEREDLVESPETDVAAAFRLWEDVTKAEKVGVIARLGRLLGR